MRNDERALLAFAHVEKRFVPTGNDLADTDAENQRRAFVVRTIKHGAVEQAALIMHHEFLADLGRRTLTSTPWHIHQARGLPVFARELFFDEPRVFGAEFRRATVLQGLSHRAVDRTAGTF